MTALVPPSGAPPATPDCCIADIDGFLIFPADLDAADTTQTTVVKSFSVVHLLMSVPIR